ncbi:ribulose-phosphate 3-epimerase [Geomicrobium sp. JCM 19038]|uniref:ribulose-phosphate 3-epimerase n=1 Tax=Geomicrobium sp. JCM 19038 TaxID=1460635 RepID=UPI00045F1B90|nr:ribulose-phosphate 3-epimerase [Geomicrobium sp. JCM 19038]GAK07476.1 ribulose-phosphate 3-epimerase [Geomicrobium sp. JCM 19038]
MAMIAPSILSADFKQLGNDIEAVSNADYIHVDVMDGKFVPNITIGPLIVDAAKRSTSLPLDVHLMIEDPDRYVEDFVKAGADIITVHVEACTHLHRTIQLIKSHGVKAGVALNPHTPVAMIQHVIEDVDLVLLMTVNPGFGGQSFIQAVLPKIAEVRKFANEVNEELLIEVDGGVNEETAKQCVEHGANLLVAGSHIYKQSDRKQAVERLKSITE